MGRAPCCSKVGLHRGPWTAKEDMLLTKFIEANGEGQWRAMPKKAGLLRCGKSCRLRWMNYLRPDIKRGNITTDEEELIVRLHRLLGNRWSLIAGRLPGRTDNEIKNFWNTHLSKKLMKKGVDPKTHQTLSNKEDARELKNCRKKKRNVYYDRKNVSEGHAQPVHLPKANRYVAFPRSSSSPNLTNPGIGLITDLELPPSYASDVLLSPTIDLNSPCSNTSQDSDNSSSEMLCDLSPVNDFVPQSVLPQNQLNNNSEDCSIPWPCIEGAEDWALSNFQSTENENVIPNSCPLHLPPASDVESRGIISYHQFISMDTDVPSQSKLSYINKQENCPNRTLQKVYDEYLELLQEDPSSSCNKIGNSIHNNDGEEMHVFSEGLSSMWDILQGDDDGNILNEDNNAGS